MRRFLISLLYLLITPIRVDAKTPSARTYRYWFLQLVTQPHHKKHESKVYAALSGIGVAKTILLSLTLLATSSVKSMDAEPLSDGPWPNWTAQQIELISNSREHFVCSGVGVIDMNAAIDGPLLFFRNASREPISICGGACMMVRLKAQKQMCTELCPPPEWRTNECDASLRNFKIAKRFVPSIEMEQFFSGLTRLQGYRIQIFRDGHGYYDGLKNVRVLGRQDFQLTPEQVQKILDKFAKQKYWDIPENQYGLQNSFGTIDWQLTVRDGSKIKVLRFGGNNQVAAFLTALEDEVRSSQWRCPFVDERTQVELCERLVRILDVGFK